MSSKIVVEYPPNYSEIKQYLNPPIGSIYAYGGVIYNPDQRQIYEDEEIHEEVHFKQQAEYTTPSIWWTKYLLDKDFRLEQELQAYSAQFRFLKEKLLAKDLKEALQEMAHALSHDYELDIDYSQAESRIKKYSVL